MTSSFRLTSLTRTCSLSSYMTCCQSVMALSYGHMGLLHRKRNVTVRTRPPYWSDGCHRSACKHEFRLCVSDFIIQWLHRP